MADTVTAEVSERAEAIAVALFRTPEGRADPYPHYHALRALAPVHYSNTAKGWMLTRYEDCSAALRDPRLLRGYAQSMDQRRPSWRDRPAIARGELMMLNLDGPAHTRQRKLVSRAFTPRTVEALRPRIEAMVDELLEPLAGSGGGDLMAALAFPLPVRVIGELLGVPDDDRAQFRALVQQLTAIFEVGATKDDLDAADEASDQIDAYFRDLIEEKRAHPGDDMLSRLVEVGDDGDRLSDEELRAMATLIFLAGFETTTNLVGNGILGLLRHPDQLALLRSQPELLPNLPEEVLRYDGTVQMNARITAEPVEIGGVVIGEGEVVFPVLGAANRDPARYDDPDRFDVTRTDIRPLSFGGGVHFCLGAALARAETEIVLGKLIARCDEIALDGMVAPRDRLTLRGPAAVPLALGTGQRRAVPAGATALPVRPGGDDTAWREQFRKQAESAAAPPDDELAARVALLARVPLFAGCEAAELEDLAATAYALSFEAGEVLCEEGAEAVECYVIAAGEATVTAGGRVLATVGADDVVGERGPLLGAPRAGTVTADSHLVTLAISRDRLKRLAEVRPAVGDAMRAHVQQRYT